MFSRGAALALLIAHMSTETELPQNKSVSNALVPEKEKVLIQGLMPAARAGTSRERGVHRPRQGVAPGGEAHEVGHAARVARAQHLRIATSACIPP